MKLVIGIPQSPEAHAVEAQAAEIREHARAQIEAAREQVEAARLQMRESAKGYTYAVTAPMAPQEPVILVPPVPPVRDIPPGWQDVYFSGLLTLAFVIVAFPIARAIARWLDRRHSRPAPLPAELSAQLSRMETAIEAMQIEVERVSESQRFLARLAADQHREQLPAGRA